LRKKDSIFDLKRTPTSAGLIPEVFRNYPGVKRSVNMHSVCAIGKHADFLTRDHINSITYWDKQSPYYRLSEINGIVFGIGLGKAFVGTILHCVESVLRTELPYFFQFFTKEVIEKYKLEDGSIVEKKSLTSDESFVRFFTDAHQLNVINKYYDKRYYKRLRFSNLNINVSEANYMINRGVELGRMGIVLFIQPKPNEFFNKKMK
jgi:aminoglycoside 3-N-acetyltransferase